MLKSFRLVALLLLSTPLMAANWQQPTAEETSMTSQAEVPGADAVVLYFEQVTDDREESAGVFDQASGKLNFHTVYSRVKILTEAGKRYADVAIEYEGHIFNVADVQGRTIHSDGTVIAFAGKPYQKVLEKSRNVTENETVFTLPDVQVGSILEWRYTVRYSSAMAVPPTWFVQGDLFVRSAKYRFRPSNHDLMDRHGELMHGAAYTNNLPKGVQVKYIPSEDVYELTMHNVPPIPQEEFMEPLHSLSYRVLFYYTPARTVSEYWTKEGRYWSGDVNKFLSSSRLKDAVATIVAPGDSEQQKTSKIYDAVMKLENTSFTREHTAAENKAAGVKSKTADDIWDQKWGDSRELTLLFIAMARAAGLKAYAMMVTNRDRELFQITYLVMWQLNEYIAIVKIDGKDQYFDPGERYCAFGQLHWKHTSTQGLRQTDSGTAIEETPAAPPDQSKDMREAHLQLDPDGKLHGFIRVIMTGVPALEWRQRALTTDEGEVKKQFEDRLRETLAPGVDVKTNHFIGLNDWKSLLMAQVDVSGSLGTATSKRVFLPSNFLEAGSRPMFVHDKRESPIYLQHPYVIQDTVSIDLPKNFMVESVPKDVKIPLPNQALYFAKYETKNNSYTVTRLLIVAQFLYAPSDYGPLKEFFQQVSSHDQEQAVLNAGQGGAGQ